MQLKSLVRTEPWMLGGVHLIHSAPGEPSILILLILKVHFAHNTCALSVISSGEVR